MRSLREASKEIGQCRYCWLLEDGQRWAPFVVTAGFVIGFDPA